MFQFLDWRWLWRLGTSYGFPWRMSRLNLQLIPTHPNRVAGLGFMGDAQRFFWIIVGALSAMAAGVLGTQTVFGGIPLHSGH